MGATISISTPNGEGFTYDLNDTVLILTGSYLEVSVAEFTKGEASLRPTPMPTRFPTNRPTRKVCKWTGCSRGGCANGSWEQSRKICFNSGFYNREHCCRYE